MRARDGRKLNLKDAVLAGLFASSFVLNISMSGCVAVTYLRAPVNVRYKTKLTVPVPEQIYRLTPT